MGAKVLYARKNESDNRQLLCEHLNNVSQISMQYSSLKNTSKLIGMLHDLGKATSAFQRYLEEGGKKGSITHSLQGGFYLNELVSEKDDDLIHIVNEIICNLVYSHHNQLHDYLTPSGDNPLLEKMLNCEDKKYFYQEVRENLDSIDKDYKKQIETLLSLSSEEINDQLENIVSIFSSQSSQLFSKGLLIKYLYSCLIDADRLDAYNFTTDDKYYDRNANWDQLINIFEDNIKKFDNSSKINKIRARISDKCKDAAQRETGIYQLTVPTGGGKTLSSLRYALHHAKKYNKKRIIYVIPYLSIIEQTAYTIQKFLNLEKDNNIILEHHSNIIQSDENEDDQYRKLLTERWDSPIIITTMVRFLETIASAKAGELRKFHNMENSVIIFDEIQTIPIKTIYIFNETVSFLSKVLNTTILLCTATQPLLEDVQRRNLLLSKNPELIENVEEDFSKLKRTNIVIEKEMNINDFSNFIDQKMAKNGNCLVIVNTRKEAKQLYINLDTSKYKIFHLSTSMCSVHRKNILEEVNKCLSSKEKVLCISTQLIEAGVDISFECVIRAMAGLESILQAAGRCNRHQENPKPKNVYVVPILNEKLENLEDIKIGKSVMDRISLEQGKGALDSTNILKRYYNEYFHIQRNKMDYVVNGDSIYRMLCNNENGRRNYKNKNGKDYPHLLGYAFKTASDNFSVIPNITKTVVVLYEKAESLLEKLLNSYNIKDKIRIVKELEKYSVSLYQYEYQSLYNNKAIREIDAELGIYVLNQENYSEKYGIIYNVDNPEYIC